jgi:hypothetical protein
MKWFRKVISLETLTASHSAMNRTAKITANWQRGRHPSTATPQQTYSLVRDKPLESNKINLYQHKWDYVRCRASKQNGCCTSRGPTEIDHTTMLHSRSYSTRALDMNEILSAITISLAKMRDAIKYWRRRCTDERKSASLYHVFHEKAEPGTCAISGRPLSSRTECGSIKLLCFVPHITKILNMNISDILKYL